MGKKIIKIFLYCLMLVLSITQTYAIVGEDLGLELYNSIDAGIVTLEQNQYEFELTNQGNGSIGETVNGILLREGIVCNIESIEDIEYISDPDSPEQIKTIIEKCTEDGLTISNNHAITILGTVSKIKHSYKDRATEKAKNMYEISKIGLYSDGNSDNSPFDLISDLINIDSIIFGGEIEYKEDPTTYGQNGGWPCDEFFCINIEYVMGTYGLSTGGDDNEGIKSIEGILKVVIGHFKKFANTSLNQNKMPADNFEFSSIIDSLPDMLRGFSIEVVWEPVPIFDKDDDINKEDQTRYNSKNQLTRYYKGLSLDYDRKNDLSIINKRINEKKVIQESVYLSITEPGKKLDELDLYEDAAEVVNKMNAVEIDRKTMTDDMKDFNDQLIELKRFTLSIKNFCQNASALIKKMVEIPTRSN